MTKPTVHGVLLDLDGTLLDHDGAAWAAFLTAAMEWLPSLSQDERSAAFGLWRSLEATWMDAYLAGSVTFQEQRRQRVLGLLAVYDLDGVNPDRMFASYLRAYEASWAGFADVPAVMPFLWEAPGGVAVLSNGDRGQQAAKLQALRLDRSPRLFVPADVGAAKPAAESFRSACAAMGWDPSTVLYVGDSLANDALAAARAGLIGCWLDRGATGTSPASIIRITSLLELPQSLAWR